jgi:hypothetical protein
MSRPRKKVEDKQEDGCWFCKRPAVFSTEIWQPYARTGDTRWFCCEVCKASSGRMHAEKCNAVGDLDKRSSGG